MPLELTQFLEYLLNALIGNSLYWFSGIQEKSLGSRKRKKDDLWVEYMESTIETNKMKQLYFRHIIEYYQVKKQLMLKAFKD